MALPIFLFCHFFLEVEHQAEGLKAGEGRKDLHASTTARETWRCLPMCGLSLDSQLSLLSRQGSSLQPCNVSTHLRC